MSAEQPPERPQDVDTAFWLWVAALPLMVAGYLVDVFAVEKLPVLVVAASVVFVVALASVVLTFQILMRHGYRWARTVLTGGGLTAVIYTASSLFTFDRPPLAATVNAVCVILGSVAIVGGVFLVHRRDAHAYFTR